MKINIISKGRNSIGFKHQSSKGILHQSLQHLKKIQVTLEDLTSNSKTPGQHWNLQLQIQRHLKDTNKFNFKFKDLSRTLEEDSFKSFIQASKFYWNQTLKPLES
jgi:hypothetical protein